jgi:hypothetical protein
VLPDQLPPSLCAGLRQLLSEIDSPAGVHSTAAAMLQGAARPGCVHLALDILVAAAAPPDAGGGTGDGHAEEGGPGTPTAGTRALQAALPPAALTALVSAGSAAQLLQAQIDGVSVAVFGEVPPGVATEWRSLEQAPQGAPRLLAALPCAVLAHRRRSRAAAAPRAAPALRVTATGVAWGFGSPRGRRGGGGGAAAGGPRSLLHARSRGVYHPLPPPLAAPGPRVSELPPEQNFTVALVPAALTPGLLLLEAESEAPAAAPPRPAAGGAGVVGGADQAVAPAQGRLLSNQLPVVVTSDARVVRELRHLEGLLAAHVAPTTSALRGPCRCGTRRSGQQSWPANPCPRDETSETGKGGHPCLLRQPTHLALPPSTPAIECRLTPPPTPAPTPGRCAPRLLTTADARQIVVDVGMLLEAEEVERDEGGHPLQGCALFRGTIRWGQSRGGVVDAQAPGACLVGSGTGCGAWRSRPPRPRSAIR